MGAILVQLRSARGGRKMEGQIVTLFIFASSVLSGTGATGAINGYLPPPPAYPIYGYPLPSYGAQVEPVCEIVNSTECRTEEQVVFEDKTYDICVDVKEAACVNTESEYCAEIKTQACSTELGNF